MSLTKSLTQPLPKRLTRSLPGDGGGDAPVPEVPPYITLQPIAVAVPVGDTFMLEMDADGIEPITFKWQRRTMGTWVDIPGATGKTYTVASASLADTGQYRGVASNLHGDSSTNAVLVEVLQAPVFTLQPVAFSDLYGEPISFTVDTEGYPAVTYQWYFKPEGGSFAALPGETAATLDLGLFDSGKVGEYYVAATNSQGTTNSNTVAAVFTGITITQQPVPMVIDHEDTISLSVAVDSVHPVTYQWFKVHTWYPDVTSYLTPVETADGQSLEPAVALAWDEFFRAMDDPAFPAPVAATHRIALLEGQLIPMIGARTLLGAAVPIGGGPVEINNFVGGDYDRVLGFTGNASNKRLWMGIDNADLPQDDFAMLVDIVSDVENHTSQAFAGIGGASDGASMLGTQSAGNLYSRNRTGTTSPLTGVSGPGLFSSIRTDGSSIAMHYEGSTQVTTARPSTPPRSGRVPVFSRDTSHANATDATLRMVAWSRAVDHAYMLGAIRNLVSSIAEALS